MALSDTCARVGCGERRGRNSAFCDEHHREQLIQAGLICSKPARTLREGCAATLRAYERSAILKDELCSALFDAGVRGFAECWQTCFDLMPEPVVADLLAYAKR